MVRYVMIRRQPVATTLMRLNMNTTTCPVCSGDGNSRHYWYDCCTCCGGSGAVPQAEVDEYGEWIDSTREDDAMIVSGHIINGMSSMAERAYDEAVRLDGWICDCLERDEEEGKLKAEDAELMRLIMTAGNALLLVRQNLDKRLPPVLVEAEEEVPF